MILPLAVGGVVLAFAPLSSWLMAAPGNPPPISLAGAVWRWVLRATGHSPYAFDWDTASYHLPGLMEFLQNGSLWSFEGPYQSYSYGFELITGFSVMAGGVLSVLVGNILGLAVAVAAGALAVAAIGRGLASRRLGWVYETVLVLIFAGLVMVAAGGSMEQLGKNDMFVTSCLLMALALLLHALTAEPGGDGPHAGQYGRVLTVIGSVMALSLAVASKPNTLAYLPLWGASAALVLWKRPLPRKTLAVVAVVAALVLVSGLAFSLRNLIAFGALTGNLSFSAWDKTVASGILRGILGMAVKPEDIRVITVLGAAAAVLAAIAALTRGLPRLAVLMTGGWLVYGLAVFTITPFSLFHDPLLIQWRLAAFSFLAGAVAFTALLDLAVSGVVRLAGPIPLVRDWTGGGRAVAAGLRAWLPAAAAAVIVITALHHTKGGTRPQQTIPLPHGEIYDLVAAQTTPLRIYAAGLRPYGLFGRKLQHRLFYDLNSSGLYDVAYGEKRLNRIRRDFRPDLIIIATDRSVPGPDPKKPLVPWLSQQPCLTEIFSIVDVSAFRVQPGCTTPWGSGAVLDGPLTMGP